MGRPQKAMGSSWDFPQDFHGMSTESHGKLIGFPQGFPQDFPQEFLQELLPAGCSRWG